MPGVTDPDSAALEKKMKDLNDAYRVFQTKTNAIAKEQRRLLAHLRELLDVKKSEDLKKKLHA